MAKLGVDIVLEILAVVCFNFGYGFESKIIMRNAWTVELKNSLLAFIVGFTSFKKRPEIGG